MSSKRRKSFKRGDDSTKMARAQVVRLSRQYKVMEGSRTTYEDEMNVQLIKQKGQLDHLREQRDRLRTADGMFTASKSRAKDEAFNVLWYLDRKKSLDRQVKTAKTDLNETKIQLFKADNELLNLRTKRMTGFVDCPRLADELTKRTRLLESKLNYAHVDMNKTMTKNGECRRQIRHLLKERLRFKEQFDDRIRDLSEGKSAILEMIESATIAFETREEAQSKLDALVEKNASLKELHTQQMRDLDRLLYTDSERVQFLTVKVKTREAEDSQSKREARGRKQELTNLSNVYNKIMDEMVQFVNGDDIDAICESFKSGEDENFAVFNYVNEVNCEAESLSDAARSVKQKIEKEKALKIERVAQQAEDWHTLENELSSIDKEILMLLKAQEVNCIGLNVVTDQLKTITDAALCNSSPFFHLVRDKQTVTLSNVHLFLMVLEKQMACGKDYSLTCLKLDVLGAVEKMGGGDDYQLLPGVFLSHRLNKTEPPNQLLQDLTVGNYSDELEAFISSRTNDYLSSLTLSVKVLDSTTTSHARKFGEQILSHLLRDTGVSARKKGGAGLGGALWAAGSVAAVGLAAMAALSGKALMTSMLALMLAGAGMLRGGGGGAGGGGGGCGKETQYVHAIHGRNMDYLDRVAIEGQQQYLPHPPDNYNPIPN